MIGFDKNLTAKKLKNGTSDSSERPIENSEIFEKMVYLPPWSQSVDW